jgi:hypothetical protein
VKDCESGFLALILTGVLIMVIGLGLMMSAVRSTDAERSGLARRAVYTPVSLFAMRVTDDAMQRR